MIAFAKSIRRKKSAEAKPAWHDGFMGLLPDIHRHVRFAFRMLKGEQREEAVQEALANALVAYVQLHKLGKTEVAYASPLVAYAVKQVCGGRQVACPLNSYDIMSPYAQRKQGFTVSRLQRPDGTDGGWKEILVEDPSCSPADLAASRIDFTAWLRRLPRQKRRIALMLAMGETTRETARNFAITPGRISQLRREFAQNWQEFHGENVRANTTAC